MLIAYKFFLIKYLDRYFIPVRQSRQSLCFPYFQLKMIMNYSYKMNFKIGTCFMVITKQAKIIPYASIFFVSRTKL